MVVGTRYMVHYINACLIIRKCLRHSLRLQYCMLCLSYTIYVNNSFPQSIVSWLGILFYYVLYSHQSPCVPLYFSFLCLTHLYNVHLLCSHNDVYTKPTKICIRTITTTSMHRDISRPNTIHCTLGMYVVEQTLTWKFAAMQMNSDLQIIDFETLAHYTYIKARYMYI